MKSMLPAQKRVLRNMLPESAGHRYIDRHIKRSDVLHNLTLHEKSKAYTSSTAAVVLNRCEVQISRYESYPNTVVTGECTSPNVSKLKFGDLSC